MLKLKMRKLLIVDDSADLLETMEFFLRKKGFDVKTILTEKNIVEEIFAFKPDLVIMDVFIHGKDGRELCKQLRENSHLKYLCIILFSSSPVALENHQAHGADACIEKPFGLNYLIDKIEEVLNICKEKHVD